MATVPLRDRHVIIFHRWRDAFADYRRYLDHDANRVTYLTTPVSRDAVPAGAAEVVVVADTQDGAAVRAALAGPVARHGVPAAVLALQEGDFAVVAQLRAEYGALGRKPADLHRFLHKHAMLDAATATGVEVPAYELVTTSAGLLRFAARAGWPLITKQMYGGASKGVRRVGSWAELPTVSSPLLVQQHLPHRVYHVDGIWDGSRLGPWRLSEYLNAPGTTTYGCLPFTDGEPVGSVEVDDPVRLRVVREFLDRLIPGMSAAPWIFHLEVFLTDDPVPRCVFLEVGARPGGADVPFVWRELHGIDLMEWEFAMQCEVAPAVRALPERPEVGGWLLVPLTAPRPCRIEASHSMLGTVPALYAEAVPPAGTVIPASDASYELVGGRFRFRGAATAEVAAQIRATARDYRVHCAPLSAAA
jgi:hypothetical protein